MTTILLAVQVDDDTAENLATSGATVIIDGAPHEVITSARIEDARNKLFLREQIATAVGDDGRKVVFDLSSITLIAAADDDTLGTQVKLNLSPILEAMGREAFHHLDHLAHPAAQAALVRDLL